MLRRGVKPARDGTMPRKAAESVARRTVVIPRVSSSAGLVRDRNGRCGRRFCETRNVHEQWLAYHGVMDNFWLAAAWSLLPTVGVSVVFFLVVRGILRFDRTERKVHAQIEAEERAARGLPPRA
jgi:hypothetical protein